MKLSVNRNEVLKYLGYAGGDVPPEIDAQIDRCAAELLAACQPRVHHLFFRLAKAPLRLEGAAFAPEGRDIADLLRECDACILLAATLGPGVDRLLSRAQVADLSRAVILDCCGSSAVENLCDQTQAALRAAWEPQGYFLTDRFSPGYGDMPLTQQQALCAVLDTARRIGLTPSRHHLLIPSKSVTALIGLAHTPQPKRPPACEICPRFRACTFRKDGKHCGKS